MIKFLTSFILIQSLIFFSIFALQISLEPETPTFINSFTAQGATSSLATVRVKIFGDYELSVFNSPYLVGASFEVFENINNQFYLKYGALFPLGVSLSMGYVLFKNWFLLETSNIRVEHKNLNAFWTKYLWNGYT